MSRSIAEKAVGIFARCGCTGSRLCRQTARTRKTGKAVYRCLMLACLLLFFARQGRGASDADALVRLAWSHLRGNASEATVKMTIHRPGWERRMVMQGRTSGNDKSLIRIVAPAKDKGNGTLKVGRRMWLYNPKINRVITLPPAMMAQSWMGSDFSNNDLAKSDSIIKDYEHRLIETKPRGSTSVARVRCLPKPGAPVVWAKVVLEIRTDGILLSERFFDEDGALVKEMTCRDIKPMGGRLFPAVWIMKKADAADSFTRLDYLSVSFLDALPPSEFTINRLKRP